MERSSNSRQLERKLRELKAERDAFERDVTVYLQENKHLKEQVEVLKSSHTASDTQAVQVLNDIRQHHKQLIELKEDEYVSELKRKDKATRFLDSKLKDVELKLKNAETKISQHKSVVEKLEENINKLQTENEKLRQIEKNHKTTSSNNTSQLKTLEKKVATLSKQNDEKEQYLASIIEKYENETEVTASKTRVRIRVLEEQIKTMKAECDKKSNDLTKTSSKLAAVSSEREAVTSQQKQKLVDVEKRLRKNLKESENTQEQLYQAKEKISCLEGEQHSMATKHRIKTKALEESLERMKKENNTKEEQLNLLNSKLSNAEKTTDNLTSKQKSQMRSLEDKIKSLQYQVEVKDDELTKAEEQLASIQSECTTLTTKHRVKTKALEEKLEKLKKECDLKDEQLHMTSHKLSSAEKTTTALTSRQKGQMRSLEEKVNQLQHELDIKDDELSKINSENKILKSRSDNLVAKQRSETQALQDKLVKAQETLDEKLVELDKVSSKLAGLENNSQATTFKQTLHARALETKLKKLESEMKQKDEKIFELTTELSNHSLEVKSVSSHQLTQVKTLEDKIQKLEAENQKREEHLYKVSTKLAHTELEGDSVASNYRVKIRALEEKSERLQQENQLKEDQLIKAESGCSEAQSKLHKLKEKIRRLELEVSRKDDELNDLRSVETEFLSKTSASMSQIQTVQREKNRLEADNKRLKTELNEMTRRISSLECDVADAKCSIKHKERQIEKLSNAENQVKLVTSEKENNEEKMQHEIMSLRLTSDQLKSEVKNLKHELQSAKIEVTQLSKDLSNEKKQCQLLKENSSASSRKLQQSQNEQRQTVEQQARTIEDLQEKLETAESALFRTKQECKSLKHQCSSSENEIAALIPLQQQVEEYRKQCSQLQNTNSAQASKFEKLVKENREMKRNLEGLGSEQLTQSRKAIELEKTSDMLKESCVMLERQVEELETFNNELIEKQDALTRERDSALSQCSTLEVELKSLQRELRNEMCEMDQNNSDQITELKIQLREEINQTHESAEEYRDLERRYKMLELNATGVQRKLTAEKDCRDRAENELERIKSDLIVMQQSLSRSEHQLHIEIDRCDEAEKEKTQLLNRMETEKLEHSHELVRLNCTGAQQIKLIDFLQSRVEELESSDKKKKKQKKTTVYQAPLQYRELCDLLEEEKASNVRLQQQVNMLRSELQDSNTKVKRIKHGMDTPLSPGSIAAISSIVKSPAPSSTISPTSKGGKLRSKPRMHHNIPHRLSTWLCTRATRCSVCLAIIHFGHSSLRCSECSVTCHTKCKKSVTNTCGLPGGLFEQFKEGTKPSNLSPITCVFKGGNQDQMHGCLKVLCGDDSWASRTVRLTSTHLRILPLNAKSPSKGEKDDVIDLSKAAYVHTDVSQAELPGTARQDLPYVFKIHTGSSNSCWPARSVFFLAAGYAEKHQWVEKLEGVTSRHNGSRNISNNAKILGNEILTLLSDEKLEMNCSLPISDKHILFGCDEGLYLLAPSTSAVSTRANMTQVKGVGKVFQMILLSKHQVVAIEGSKHRLVTFDISTITEHKVALQDAEVENCHVIACGHAEGVHYLCAASASSVTILKYNERLKKFCKQKEVATSEPCTCMLFTACSVIIGTNTFYEIDLTDYKIDEFLNIGDRALSRRLKDSSIFPVAVLKIKDEEGRQEFLLCFHEFGLFVDGFGRLTREGQISWSRMPLSFEYREPYLVVVQFNSVEILQLDSTQDVSAEEAVIDHSFLSFPSGRFLGPAITSGAVYLSSVEGSRTSVFCCKGNMKGGSREAVKIANKRRYAALSASTDSLASPTVKRSSALSDMSNLRESRDISSSCQSIDTSRWTSGPSDCDAISVDTNTDSETLINTATDSDTVVPSSEEGSTSDAYSDDVSARLRWRPVQSSTTRKAAPAKPARRRDMASGSKYGQVPSTEV